jgi:molecular chaperone GrpE
LAALIDWQTVCLLYFCKHFNATRDMEDNRSTFEDAEMPMDINSDADVPGNNHLSNPASDAETENDLLTSALQDQKDKYIRLFAEFDNYKRRTAKERIELIQTAGKEIIVSLLDVLDDCDRAEKQMDTSNDLKLIREGNRLVFHKLRTILQQKGLNSESSIGNAFDVEKHEAISEIEAGEELIGKVVDELEKGYYLNDKIIRFARVVVGK